MDNVINCVTEAEVEFERVAVLVLMNTERVEKKKKAKRNKSIFFMRVLLKLLAFSQHWFCPFSAL